MLITVTHFASSATGLYPWNLCFSPDIAPRIVDPGFGHVRVCAALQGEA